VRNCDDPTFSRFLDLFHHRMLALFYRAWAAPQPAANFDRPHFRFPEDGGADRYALYVGASIGLAMPSLRDRDSVSDLAKLHYAGRLVCPTHHPEGLRAILQDYFAIRARIAEFVGDWVDIPEADRGRLGESPSNGALGRTALIGTRVWDCQQKFRIVAGPLSLEEYERFLPESPSLLRLVDVVRLYAGDELRWDLQLILRKEEVPPLLLGRSGRLGRTTWLASRPAQRDPTVVLDPLRN
jgi:type VI secretion system protein ImpH